MERKFGKMEKKTQLKKSGPAKPAYKAGAKENVIQDITNRFRVTAREARDIVTAVGTLGKLTFDKDAQYSRYSTPKAERAKAVRNIKNQVSETVTAAKTGKKGTTSGVATFSDGEVPYTYGSGRKRR